MDHATPLSVPDPTGISGDCATLFVSLELSRSTWVATSLALGSRKMSKHTLVGGDARKPRPSCAVEEQSRATYGSAGQDCSDPGSRARRFLDSSLARGQWC